MAQRAGAHITEINAPHLSMISDPGAVTGVILNAARRQANPPGLGAPAPSRCRDTGSDQCTGSPHDRSRRTTMTTSSVPVVFIHGLWIHSAAWQPSVELYRSAGYDPIAPGWPGDSDTADNTRKNAAAVANKGLDDITNGYLDVISDLPTRPIVIGQSFGGLVAQKLLSGGKRRRRSRSTQARSRGQAGAVRADPLRPPGCCPSPATASGRSLSPGSSSATASAARCPAS